MGEGIKFLQLLDDHIDAIAKKHGVKTSQAQYQQQRSASVKTAAAHATSRDAGHRATVSASSTPQQPPLPPRNNPVSIPSGIRAPLTLPAVGSSPVSSPSSNRRLMARSHSARASSSSSSRSSPAAQPPTPPAPLPLPTTPEGVGDQHHPLARAVSAAAGPVRLSISEEEDVGVSYTDVELNVPAATAHNMLPQRSKSAAASSSSSSTSTSKIGNSSTSSTSSTSNNINNNSNASDNKNQGKGGGAGGDDGLDSSLSYAVVDISKTEALAAAIHSPPQVASQGGLSAPAAQPQRKSSFNITRKSSKGGSKKTTSPVRPTRHDVLLASPEAAEVYTTVKPFAWKKATKDVRDEIDDLLRELEAEHPETFSSTTTTAAAGSQGEKGLPPPLPCVPSASNVAHYINAAVVLEHHDASAT